MNSPSKARGNPETVFIRLEGHRGLPGKYLAQIIDICEMFYGEGSVRVHADYNDQTDGSPDIILVIKSTKELETSSEQIQKTKEIEEI